MAKLTYGTFSILFKSEWGKDNKNVSSVNKRKVECSGMGGGIGGWLEQQFSKCGPETSSIDHTRESLETQILRPSLQLCCGGAQQSII